MKTLRYEMIPNLGFEIIEQFIKIKLKLTYR